MSHSEDHNSKQQTDQSTEVESNTQMETHPTLKGARKRKDYSRRSVVWRHFTDFTDAEGRKKCTCNYCKREYSCASKACDTSTLLNHMKVCPLHPANQSSNQTSYQSTNDDDDMGDVKSSLVAWKFDQQVCRKALAKMIITDELPFKFVEGIGFRHYMKVCQHAHVIPSRTTVTRDCYQLFLDEKKKLRSLMKEKSLRICLTIDTWISLQRINYICITAHYIDNEWKLHKKVLNFCPVSSDRGNDIGKAVEMCLVDWDLQNVFTVTVDNASSNDVAIDYVKKKLVNWNKCVVQAKWVHVRCVAHIINLIVQDGLNDFEKLVDCVRAAVRYVRQSPARLKRFMHYAKIEKCDYSKTLCLDVPTGWNSTYLMLNVAHMYERAFDRLDLEEPTFRDDLQTHGSKLGVPTTQDWDNVRRLVGFLQHFYELTLKVSGTKYITADSFLDEIYCIHGSLKEGISSEDDDFRNMAIQMKRKFDKYWGSFEKFNVLIFIASILDPRNKFEYVDIVLGNMYGDQEGSKLAEKVKDALYELFNEYKRIHFPPIATSSSGSSFSTSLIVHSMEKSSATSYSQSLNQWKEKFRAELKRRKADSKSELDRYLTENDVDDEYDSENFSILEWWKVNSPRFPILSFIARDVLAVPISTVTSESAFCTGERVLDTFRSSLTPKIVQALICTQDWFRSNATSVNVEEHIEDLENFEKEINDSNPESYVDI